MTVTPADPLKRAARVLAPSLFVIAVALALSVRLGAFLWRYSVNVLFYDQWDYLAAFFDHEPGVAELFFWQHGPHREGLGLIADKFLYPLTAWNVRVDSFLIGSCLVAAMLLALLLKKRLFGRIDYWDAVIPMIFLTLVQYDTFLVTPNPAYSGFPILLLMLYLLALVRLTETRQSEITKYGVVLFINYLLIYTGFGVFMGPISIGLFVILCYRALCDRRQRGSVALPLGVPVGGLLIACASFASFFYRYRFDPAVSCFVFPDPHSQNYARFVALMFAKFTGIRSSISWLLVLGTVLVVFAIYVLVLQLRGIARADALPQTSTAEISLTTAILVSYSLLFAANTAIGRVCLGLPQAAQASRYCTLLIPAFLGIYFCLRSATLGKIRQVALAALVAALIPGQIHVPGEAAYYADRKRAWVACYLKTSDIGACDALTKFAIYPDPKRTRLREKLDYLRLIQANLFAE